MKIALLYFPHREGHNSIFPFFLYKSQIESSGIKLQLFTSLKKLKEGSFDILFISGLSLPKLLGKQNTKEEFLKILYDQKEYPVIFLSGNDSTGPIQKEILNLVDLYLSKQILKDKNLYLIPHKRHYFREKMMDLFRFKNENKFVPVSLEEKDLSKLGVSWNLALIDWKTQTSTKWKRYLTIFLKNKKPISPERVKPLIERRIPIMFKGNLFPKEHDVSRLHRLLTFRVASKIKTNAPPVSNSPLSHKEYLEQMKETVISLSPFGWGEICYRDFEAFRTGSLLFKPEMDHIETFPDLYTSENHISYRWDSSDLEEKIKDVLDDPSSFQKLALQGKIDFENVLNPEIFGKKFLQHLNGIIFKARENFEKRPKIQSNESGR
ncbi:hypothetical protein SAMN04488519_10799 [Algoriphagus ornithinivorans]|uniref:Glycosyl transferases group 1 n=1 Tax=Algoriphagus ornithinivorans TaxID=226506 RepID=A0A1I5HKB5_9BACT|nr:hypothetical protein [Algoriphagus ornithinivorans]SFO48732.1 hypothetical protein SAMN04488519_10799 [Algoriphagus ornithinivorans]